MHGYGDRSFLKVLGLETDIRQYFFSLVNQRLNMIRVNITKQACMIRLSIPSQLWSYIKKGIRICKIMCAVIKHDCDKTAQ